MESLITTIDEKFGGSASISINMDFSGYIDIYDFKTQNHTIVFEFDDVRELTLSQTDSIVCPA